MALMYCPECGGSVSDRAQKCPKCGYPIQEYLKKRNQMTAQENKNGEADDSGEKQRECLKQKRNKRTVLIALIAFCTIVVIVAGGILWRWIYTAYVPVKNITIEKWRLTDTGSYFDDYEGTIVSEQKKPFIAIIGRYDIEHQAPQFVYMENGVGTMETLEHDDDPSIKYRPIGYLNGNRVNESDLKVTYTDGDYFDLSYGDVTWCDVRFDIRLNRNKTGMLLFDIVNESANDMKRNVMVPVVNGRAEYTYNAISLPYKTRGIDITIIPRMFCQSDEISQDDYVIEKEYTAEGDKNDYFNSYSGEEVLRFEGFQDGFVLYTEELKAGGEKEQRNQVRSMCAFLSLENCSVDTYDSVDADQEILEPEYEFKIVGYLTWKTL